MSKKFSAMTFASAIVLGGILGGCSTSVERMDTAETRDLLLRQASMRVGLRFRPTRIVSWDHRKLGG